MDFGIRRVPVVNIQVDYNSKRKLYGLIVNANGMPNGTMLVIHPDANDPSVQLETAEKRGETSLRFEVPSEQLFVIYIVDTATSNVPYVVSGIIVDPGSTILFSKNPSNADTSTNKDLSAYWRWMPGSYFK